MNRMQRIAWTLSLLGAITLLVGCDGLLCLISNPASTQSNPNFMQRVAGTSAFSVPARPANLAVCPDGKYVAVCSWGPQGGDPNGTLSLYSLDPAIPTQTNNEVVIGVRPYGLLWLNDQILLVCNEGQEGDATNAHLMRVTLTRGSEVPTDPNYRVRTLDPAHIEPVNANPADPDDRISRPSEIVRVPDTDPSLGVIAVVSSRYEGTIKIVREVTAVAPTALEATTVLTTAGDTIIGPRGIAVSADGSTLWICNYDSGATGSAIVSPTGMGEVTVYDITAGTILARIAVPPRPNSIRLTEDGGAAVVACSGDDGATGSVVLLSTSAHVVTAQRDFIFSPAQVRLHPLGSRAYVSAFNGNRLGVINIAGLCATTGTVAADTQTHTTIFSEVRAIDVTPNIDVIIGASFASNEAAKLDVFEGVISLP